MQFGMEFSAKQCMNSLDLAPAGDDVSSGESGTTERGISSSSLFSEKLGNDGLVVRFEVKEILRRKLQGKTKSMLAEVDLSKSGILNFLLRASPAKY